MPVNPTLPTPGGDSGTWGTKINTALQALDSGKSDVNHGSTHLTGGTDAIPTFNASTSGIVPASGGGTANYLRADGTWAAPAGGGSSGKWDATVVDVTDYGALGDAVKFTASMSAAGTTVTATSGVFTSSGACVGKKLVIENAGGAYGTYMPLVTTITGWTSTTVVTVANAATIAVSGATGYWGTDDSTAFANAWNAVVASKTQFSGGANGDRPVAKALYMPANKKYLITAQNSLLNSPVTGSAEQLKDVLVRGGNGRTGVEIIFCTNVSTTSDPRNGNLILAANRLRNATFQNFAVRSLNPNQSFAYLWCSWQNDGTYPLYGSGAQNDVRWDNIELRGKWANGWVFDGDTSANLNSEQTWTRCQTSNSATFRGGIINSGGISGTAQEDQFLNYVLYNCYWEYGWGGDMDFSKGGYITCIGGSYISGITQYNVTNKVATGGTATLTVASHDFYVGQVIGVDINDANLDGVQTITAITPTTIAFASGATIASTAVSAGTVGGGASFWKMGNFSHFSDVMHLNCIGTRFEARNPAVKLIDTWWAGATAHIEFTGITLATNYLTYVGSGYRMATFNQSSPNFGNVMPHVAFNNCELPGHVYFSSTSANPGTTPNSAQNGLYFRQCNFRDNTGGIGTSTGFVRHDGTHIPKYYYDRCYNVTSGGTYT